MSETVQLALIASSTGILAPLLLAWLTNQHRRMEKQEDYARQDEVAAKAEKAQLAMTDHATEVARLLVISNKVASDAADAQTVLMEQNRGKLDEHSGKLDEIHILVNSNLTSAMQSELDALTANLILLKEIVELKTKARETPLPETDAMIMKVQARIIELNILITGRKLH